MSENDEWVFIPGRVRIGSCGDMEGYEGQDPEPEAAA